MSPANRGPLVMLMGVALLVIASMAFSRGMAMGRIFAFGEIALFSFGMIWKLILGVIVYLWLRSALGKKGD